MREGGSVWLPPDCEGGPRSPAATHSVCHVRTLDPYSILCSLDKMASFFEKPIAVIIASPSRATIPGVMQSLSSPCLRA